MLLQKLQSHIFSSLKKEENQDYQKRKETNALVVQVFNCVKVLTLE